MSEWISVKDRLPEKHQHVLVYGNGHYATCHFEGEDYWNKYLFLSYDWQHNITGCTHWMPLPEAPK